MGLKCSYYESAAFLNQTASTVDLKAGAGPRVDLQLVRGVWCGQFHKRIADGNKLFTVLWSLVCVSLAVCVCVCVWFSCTHTLIDYYSRMQGDLF